MNHPFSDFDAKTVGLPMNLQFLLARFMPAASMGIVPGSSIGASGYAILRATYIWFWCASPRHATDGE